MQSKFHDIWLKTNLALIFLSFNLLRASVYPQCSSGSSILRPNQSTKWNSGEKYVDFFLLNIYTSDLRVSPCDGHHDGYTMWKIDRKYGKKVNVGYNKKTTSTLTTIDQHCLCQQFYNGGRSASVGTLNRGIPINHQLIKIHRIF